LRGLSGTRWLRKLSCKRVQMDEIWSFVYAKNDNVKDAKAAPARPLGTFGRGPAICADTKLLVSWLLVPAIWMPIWRSRMIWKVGLPIVCS